MLNNKEGERSGSLMNKSHESAISSVSATGCQQTEWRIVLREGRRHHICVCCACRRLSPAAQELCGAGQVSVCVRLSGLEQLGCNEVGPVAASLSEDQCGF